MEIDDVPFLCTIIIIYRDILNMITYLIKLKNLLIENKPTNATAKIKSDSK